MIPGSLPLKRVSLYHLPTTAGATQPYPSTPDLTVDGALIPQNLKQTALEGEYVNPHNLFVDSTVDVRMGDQAVIEGKTYFVRKVTSFGFGPMHHQRCTVSSDK